ncbi:hypothetical protein ACOMHN_027676 [Nucella lapillus]
MDSDGEEYTPSRLFNPCPPPGQERSVDPDAIEGTEYTKAWVLSILKNLMKEVEKHEGVEGGDEVVVEVEESQQNDLSRLWDMTIESEVTRFLMKMEEFNTGKALTYAVYKSKAPRLKEVCLGMLKNICNEPEFCTELSANEDFVKMICTLLDNCEFDTPTLREAMRLVQTCLGHAALRQQWLQALVDTPGLFPLIAFVLKSSVDVQLLNITGAVCCPVQLLNITGTLLDTLLDKRDELCDQWATTDLVDSITVAMRQLGHREKEKVKPFLSVFQLLSTTQAGVQCLVECREKVLGAVLNWLWQVCDDDILVLKDHMPHHTCAISVITLLFNNVPETADYIATKTSVMRDMLKTLGSLYNIYLTHGDPAALPKCIFFTPRLNLTIREALEGGSSQPENRSTNPQTATDQECSTDSVDVKKRTHYRDLLESLQEYFHAFFTHLTLQGEEENGEGRKRRRSSRSVPFRSVLKHLDRCPRHVLTYLVSVLVYNIPPSVETGGQRSGQDGTSGEGWGVVSHMHRLFDALSFDRAVEMLDDIVNTVRLTAGEEDSAS